MIHFLKSSMSGIAQVIVQPCALTGLIILASIAFHSWKMALGAFFGTIIGTATAKIFKLDNKDTALGIYGYNATLIGIANIYFFQVTPLFIGIFVLSCFFICICYEVDPTIFQTSCIYCTFCFHHMVSNTWVRHNTTRACY